MTGDMVKPMPASVPAPASCRHVWAFGFSAAPSRTASAVQARLGVPYAVWECAPPGSTTPASDSPTASGS